MSNKQFSRKESKSWVQLTKRPRIVSALSSGIRTTNILTMKSLTLANISKRQWTNLWCWRMKFFSWSRTQASLCGLNSLRMRYIGSPSSTTAPTILPHSPISQTQGRQLELWRKSYAPCARWMLRRRLWGEARSLVSSSKISIWQWKIPDLSQGHKSFWIRACLPSLDKCAFSCS